MKLENVEDIYPLAPLQEGILFHTVAAPEAGHYVRQAVRSLEGSLDLPAFRRAWQWVLERHPVLRTAFVWEGVERPVQVVWRRVDVPFQEEDWRDLTPPEQAAELDAFLELDRRRGFVVSRAPLMRVAVFRTGAESWDLVWSFHHLLLDGWSLALVIERLLASYGALMQGQEPPPPPGRPYRDYIAWLAARDASEAETFWRRELAGFRAPTPLPGDRGAAAGTAGGATAGLEVALPGPVTEALGALARRHRLTPAVVTQAAWGLLLARAGGEGEVVFGAVTSGRPPELPEYESMVGMFINTVPVRLAVPAAAPAATWLAEVRDRLAAVREFEHSPLVKVQGWGEVPRGRPLFDSIVVFENYSLEPAVGNGSGGAEEAVAGHGRVRERAGRFLAGSSYPLTLVAKPGPALRLRLDYDGRRFEATTVERTLGHLSRLLAAFAATPERRLAALELLSPAERHQLVAEWNDTGEGARAPAVHRAVAARVREAPDALAVSWEDGRLTYGELYRRALGVAVELTAAGLGGGAIAALVSGRSPDLLAGALGTLLAGGAYLPVDPAYPEARIALLLEDSAAAVVLAETAALARLPAGRPRTLVLDGGLAPEARGSETVPEARGSETVPEARGSETVPEARGSESVPEARGSESVPEAWGAETVAGARRPGAPPEALAALALPEAPEPGELAYVIYTSGSTGRPKGVAVSHGALANLVAWHRAAFGVTAGDRATLVAAPGFDASVWETWPYLAAGASLHLPAQETVRSPAELVGWLAARAVTVSFLPTPLAEAALGEAWPAGVALRALLTGGDRLRRGLPRALGAGLGLRLHNQYGPTENAVVSTTCPVDEGGPEAPAPPIGRPLPGVQAHLLDRGLRSVGIGVAAELCLGGASLARGYRGRPALTAAAFVPDPVGGRSGARLYRSGDRVRARADGALEFLGRIDEQVKVRGFRLEPGEIEAALAGHPGVAECAVVVREEGEGKQRLVAYVVGAEGGSVDAGELRRWLAERLPEHMVPSAFVTLAALPTTAHGKLDRRALPAPGSARPELEHPYVPPRNETEEALAGVWGHVLGLDRVGVEDDFFELGGDSILALQIVSKARQAGLAITPTQIFQHPTLADLAMMASRGEEVRTEQGAVTGAAPLTPIQALFFAMELPDPHHFNQALLLELRRRIEPSWLLAAVARLLAHHDALRLRFTREGAGWRQENAAPGGGIPYGALDLGSVAPEDRRLVLEAVSARAQESLHLTRGPLLRAVHFLAGDGADRLLMCIHHLAVDGVSWRILLEDLALLADAAARGRVVTLPPKTTSFRQWAEKLEAYGRSPAVAPQVEHWAATLERPAGSLPVDLPGGDNTRASSEEVQVELEEAETQALLQTAHRAYRTRIDDLLLAALALSLTRWTGSRAVLVDLEGHGREEALCGADLSRTVGWFTALYPVRLVAGGPRRPGEVIKGVKEALRRVPDRGVSFGLLRYLGEEGVRRRLAAPQGAEVVFNYLGRADRVGRRRDGERSLFAPARESRGPAATSTGRRTYLLKINASVADGRLEMRWGFSANLHRRSTVESVAEGFVAALRGLLRHCLSPEAGGCTPSDFPLAGLDQATVDRLAGDGRSVEDLYPLSPLQEGMLFHSLYDRRSGQYAQLLACTLRGELDVSAFSRAWLYLLARHAVLRTSFVWEGLERPLQRVAARVDPPLFRIDLRRLASAHRAAVAADLQERGVERGVAPGEAPLLRLVLARLTDDAWRLVWNYHHALLDGWSFSQLEPELLAAYRAAAAGRQPRFPPRRPYRDYIAWLAQRDPATAEELWRGALTGFSSPTPLPGAGPGAGPGSQRRHRAERRLAPAAVAGLEAAARRLRVTLNTLVQGAWGLLLGRYCGEEDVLFGAVVAGRPAELPGVESILGLFINTLPVRLRLPAGARVGAWLAELLAEQARLRQVEDSPLIRIQGWSDVPRGVPLFESLLVFENFPVDASFREHAMEEVTFAAEDVVTSERTNYPLTAVAVPRSGLLLKLTYDPARLDDPTAGRLLRHWEALLAGLAGDPERRLGELGPLSAAERHQLLAESSGAGTGEPRTAPLAHRAIAARGATSPEAVAVEEAGKVLSLGGLLALARWLAGRLRGRGVQPEARVGAHLPRSGEAVATLLGILEAGAAYVPLDPADPPERLEYLARDAGLALVVTGSSPGSGQAWGGVPALVFDGAAALEPARGTPGPDPDPLSLAYVVYTSGSTGRPKGVAVSHRTLAAHCRGMVEFLSLGPQDRVLQFAPLGFDVALEQVLPSLAAGARVVLRPPEVPDGAGLRRLVATRRVTVANLPTAYWRLLCEDWAGLPAPAPEARLRMLMVGGDRILPEDLERWWRLPSPAARLFNFYGPTEATVTSTAHLFPPPRSGAPPQAVAIGRPLGARIVHLLDRRGRPVPLGGVGELALGGGYAARGYLGRPGRTAERFVPDPFSARPGARFYLTGDLARLGDGGALEFVGRADRQVKVRGFRVEPGEVEAVLGSHPGVGEAVVVTPRDRQGERLLVAYFVPLREAAPEDVSPRALRSFLADALPAAMLPAALVPREELPLTVTGKVDRRALEAAGAPEEPAGEGAAERPASPSEEIVAAVWSAVLGLEEVGTDDDFFHLGGHSLLAVRVASRLGEAFAIEVPLRDLFEAPTVAALARRIDAARTGSAAAGLPPVVPVPRRGPDGSPRELPLSFAQERLLFIQRLDPESSAYNLPTAVRFRGPLQVAALARTLTELVRRHESLRTTCGRVEGRPVQVVASPVPVGLPAVDLQALAPEHREAGARLLGEAEARRPFDLAWGPLLRPVLIRLSEDDHAVLATMHHIVSDGWSRDVLRREVGTLYRAFSNGRPSPLPELPVQYADFAQWQRRWLSGEVLGGELAFWRRRLGAAPPVLELPTDRPRRPAVSYPGAREPFRPEPGVTTAVTALARRRGATPFMTLLAAFCALLGRYAGRSRVSVGTPVAGRPRPEVEGLIGFFVNTLVLPVEVAGDPSFAELLARVRETALDAYDHQHLPFEKLVAELAPERSLLHTPLFQVMLSLQHPSGETQPAPGLSAEPMVVGREAAKFELHLALVEEAGALTGSLVYRTDLFDATTARRLLGHLGRLLEGAVAAPDRRLSELSLLAPAERHQVAREWGDRRLGVESADGSLDGAFLAQAASCPEAVAVSCGPQRLSYGELAARAEGLGAVLGARGAAPGSRVGIALERGPDLVVAIVGVLRAGCAYVPLDPSYPEERLAYLAADSGASLAVTGQGGLPGSLAGSVAQVRVPAGGGVEAGGGRGAAVGGRRWDAAYVIYTSGSTGRPKGVVVSHGNVLSLFGATAGAFAPGREDVWTLFHSYAFDFSVWEVWGALLHGGRVAVVPYVESRSPEAVWDLVVREGVTVLSQTPSAFRGLSRAAVGAGGGAGRLRWVVFGGEALEPSSLRPWFEAFGEARPGLVNMYGITETTVHVTLRRVWARDASVGTGSRIGRAIGSLDLYVAEGGLAPAPVGVAGELYVGGGGVTRGYLGRPGLTASRFVPHPWPVVGGERLYRTGDLARWVADGDVEYLGRLDSQVKVRGFRIEPGEIEAALSRHPGVAECAVVLREEDEGERRLVAYVVPVPGVSVGAGELRRWLSGRLPEHMVPSAFVELPELPTTAHGKLDRRALPAPGSARPDLDRPYVPPRDDVEAVVAGIWAEVLGLDRVGVEDDFFGLGGHSLLAMQVFYRLEDLFRTEIPLRAIFQGATVSDLARALVEQGQRPGEVARIAATTRRIQEMSDQDVRRLLASKQGGGA